MKKMEMSGVFTQSVTVGSSSAGTVNIGNGTNQNGTLTLGTGSGIGTVNIGTETNGVGALNVGNGTGGGIVIVGNGTNSAGTLYLGSQGGAGVAYIGNGTSSPGTIYLGSTGGGGSLYVGNGTDASGILNVGTGTGVATVQFGSASGSGSVTLGNTTTLTVGTGATTLGGTLQVAGNTTISAGNLSVTGVSTTQASISLTGDNYPAYFLTNTLLGTGLTSSQIYKDNTTGAITFGHIGTAGANPPFLSSFPTVTTGASSQNVYTATTHTFSTDSGAQIMSINSSGSTSVDLTLGRTGSTWRHNVQDAYRYNIIPVNSLVSSPFMYLDASNDSTWALKWQIPSDERLKTEIKSLTDGLDVILQAKPRTYKFKSSGQNASLCIGFIAQEIQQIPALKYMVTNSSVKDIDGTYFLAMSTTAFIPHLVLAIQEQQAIIQKLMDRVQALEER